MEWRLKGTAGTFSTLSNKNKYKTALDVRNAIKSAMGIPEDGILNIVLYRNTKPDLVVSDLERVSLNEKFLVSRVSSTQANELLAQAAKDYSCNDQSPSYDDEPSDVISSGLNTQRLESNETNTMNGTFINDDEDAKIASAMAAGGLDIQDTLQRRYYRNKTLQDSGKVPSLKLVEDKNTYICHMCGNPGHNIKDCTIVDGRRCEKKIRSATGIPVNFLKTIRQDEIQNYKEVYILKDGTFAVMKDISTVSGEAYFNISAEERISVSLGNQVKSQFKCPKCGNLLADPMTTLCCGETFCSNCLFQNKTSAIFPCPGCARRIGVRYLEPNVALREVLKNTLENDKSNQSNIQKPNNKNSRSDDDNSRPLKDRKINKYDENKNDRHDFKNKDFRNDRIAKNDRDDKRDHQYSRQRVLASEYISHYRKNG